MTNIIIDSLRDWCKEVFLGVLVPREESMSSLTNGVAFTLTDDQCPFGGKLRIALIQTDGGIIDVQSWCKRYSCGRVPPDFTRSSTERLITPLGHPDSIPKVMEELFQISFDYCRWLYRKAIKDRRKHLKPLISEIAELFRQERNQCRAIDYQLGNHELSTIC